MMPFVFILIKLLFKMKRKQIKK